LRLVTALDIGSSKVCALIAQRGEGNALKILGTGQRESRGVKRGYISDMEITERAVREAVEQAERIAGINIEDVWVSFSAGGLVSDVANVEVELGGHRIEQQDIDELLAAGAGRSTTKGAWCCTRSRRCTRWTGCTG
jgi:cell division protein FtsA